MFQLSTMIWAFLTLIPLVLAVRTAIKQKLKWDENDLTERPKQYIKISILFVVFLVILINPPYKQTANTNSTLKFNQEVQEYGVDRIPPTKRYQASDNREEIEIITGD